jgi:hypothetical protein
MPKRKNETTIYTPQMKELNTKINEYKLKLKEMRQKLKIYISEQKDKDIIKKNNMCDSKEFLTVILD